MARGQILEFVGSPLPGGSKRNTFYPAYKGDNISVKLGDTVLVQQPEGTFYGIVLVLWQQGIRPKTRKQWAEILWFHRPHLDKQELQITPVTSCVDIVEIAKIISVCSYARWAEEEELSTKRSKAFRMTRFFCQRGYHEQSRVSTNHFDWDVIYSEKDLEDLETFREKIVEMIIDYAKSKVSTKLKARIKSQKKMELAPVEFSDDGSSEDSGSDSSSAASSASSYDDESLSETFANRRRPAPLDDDNDFNDVITSKITNPRTPKKPKLNSSASTPRTPKRFTTISTPGSKSYRVQSALEVTPLPSRIKFLDLENGLSPHQLARQRLHVAEVPLSLPCREAEFANILEQVESAILENESALIYVSGTPGTGKTATVREVINVLQQKVADEELFPFKYVEINGMKIPDPSQAYSKLWETLTGQRVTANHALTLLQGQFKSRTSSRIPCVVLMDELDQLTTTKQEVMYNFFQWPNMPNTRLIVIAVANTMDLPERSLAHKVSSRLGLTRIAFTAYTRPQLNEIIRSRLANVDSIDVDNDAIDYACMRVSRVSGDARRALDICRRAFELAEPDFSTAPPHFHGTTASGTPTTTPTKSRRNGPAATGRVTMQIMQRAFTEMTTSPLQMYLKSLPFLSKIFLKSLVSCTRRSGVSETSLGEVMEDAARVCKVNTHPWLEVLMGHLQPYGIVAAAETLSGCGILYMDEASESGEGSGASGERGRRVRLRIPEQDLIASWAEDETLMKIT